MISSSLGEVKCEISQGLSQGGNCTGAVSPGGSSHPQLQPHIPQDAREAVPRQTLSSILPPAEAEGQPDFSFSLFKT